jgi:23S rRNA (cytidine2498-2'-O)-methyltransferase
VGAERALKAEVARLWPSFHFAYSRPGFLTFKLPPSVVLPDDFELGSVFSRAHGFSLGKVSADTVEQRALDLWRLVGDRSFDALHVWQRDTARPGWRGFEPHVTPLARVSEAAIRRAAPGAPDAEAGLDERALPRIAAPCARVLDCVLVEPHEWWVGWHLARDESCFPGGLREIELPTSAVSRAYLKMVESLAWSALPVTRGQRVAELGCAPGGASQALLDRGLLVIGIDPAVVDPRVVEHPRFTHLRKRADDVRRRDFRGVAWLAADMNVAPETTLDAVEAIVTYPAVNIRGLLLTLKLLDWRMAEAIPGYLERIARWGYKNVRARQLAHNRQEICVSAQCKPAKRRTRKRPARGRRV